MFRRAQRVDRCGGGCDGGKNQAAVGTQFRANIGPSGRPAKRWM
jgi:hypothetical protein